MGQILPRAILVFALSVLLSAGAQASKIETYQFEDPAREQTYRKLTEELRCLVCQNQNLADSNAELAEDMRRKTYEMVSSGKSENEVVDYWVQRYGDFVLYRPPFSVNTLLLWIGPFIILIVGVAVLLRFVRRKPALNTDAMSGEDRARAESLLGGKEEEK